MTVVDTSDVMESALSKNEHSGASDDVGVQPNAERIKTDSGKTPRRLTISVRAVIVVAAVCVLAAATGFFGWLYLGARAKLDAQAFELSNRERAQSVATDYAVHAAEMDYQDFNGWKVKLVKGTSPELKDKLTKAANSMEQILAPMQWKSTSKPLAAVVRSNAGGIYVVDSFVSVLTKTMQTPEGLQSTATYSVTIDSNNNWQITDVGGVGSVLGK